jgi:hypothetical protein
MIKVDIRSENSAYITIGKWVIYVDDSTGEQFIDSWEDKEIEEKKNEKKLQAPSSPAGLKKDTIK